MNQQVSPVVPASIVTSVQQRLAGLSTETVDVLTAAAILGSQFDLTLLGDVAGVGEHAAISALNAASGVQLVQPRTSDDDEFSFRHPLIREAIVADLHPADRATRARQAAVAIELAHPDLPGSWCELA